MNEIIDLLRKHDVSMTIDPRRPGTMDQVVISLRKDGKTDIHHRMDYAFDMLNASRYMGAIDEFIPRLIEDFADEVKFKEGMTGGFKIMDIDVLPCICEDHCYPVERYDSVQRGFAELTRLWLECPSCHARSFASQDFTAVVMDWNDMNKVDRVRQRDEK